MAARLRALILPAILVGLQPEKAIPVTPETMLRVISIGLAGLAGTLARYWLSGLIARRFGETFPTGTLVVNVVGCFLAGFLAYSLFERFLVSETSRTMVMIGFLGGFTTFSSFGLQSFNLLRDGEVTLALLNIGLSNIAGLLMIWLGFTVAKIL